MMNPYTVTMVGIPVLLSVIASLAKKPVIKWTLLILATAIYWVILQKYVNWAFTHPFNPNDGGPRTFAYLFGWLYGLIIVIIPTYWISKGTQCLVKRIKK